jgi:hypothetical protein
MGVFELMFISLVPVLAIGIGVLLWQKRRKK